MPGLVAALRRRPTDAQKDAFWRGVVLDALEGATGQDLGNAPDAWEAWFRQRQK